MGRMVFAALAAVMLCACFTKPQPFEGGGDDQPPIDAPQGDAPIDGSGSCTGTSAMCSNASLLTCAGAGADPVTTACAWGCASVGTPRCLRIAPAGGGGAAADLDPATDLVDVTLDGVIDGSTGEISGLTARPQGTGVQAGIGYEIQGGVAVFRFKSVTVSGALELRGANAIAIVANGAIMIGAPIDGTLACTGPLGRGPGGFAGGAPGIGAAGPGAGGPGAATSHGGGGGGHGHPGGLGGSMGGGTPAAGGGMFTFTTVLRGGGGGGGGNSSTGGVGGGGGAALQLVSNAAVTMSSSGGINAGGCGGRGTPSQSPGGGGGAGGLIVIEAPDVSLEGLLAVNGGGGGAGDVTGGAGATGLPTRAPASGGAPFTGIGNGGEGGFGTTLPTRMHGQPGFGSSRSGGGGGAVGRILINTPSGVATIEASNMSPAFTDPNTTATQGTPALQ